MYFQYELYICISHLYFNSIKYSRSILVSHKTIFSFYLLQNILLPRRNNTSNYDFSIRYENTWLNFAQFQYMQLYLTISAHIFHQGRDRPIDLQQHIDNQLDDIQPQHRLYPNYYNIFDPMFHCRIHPHDQYHWNLMVLTIGPLPISL